LESLDLFIEEGWWPTESNGDGASENLDSFYGFS
jgi:hypothetical protein